VVAYIITYVPIIPNPDVLVTIIPKQIVGRHISSGTIRGFAILSRVCPCIRRLMVPLYLPYKVCKNHYPAPPPCKINPKLL
jgi:hypothetical protein